MAVAYLGNGTTQEAHVNWGTPAGIFPIPGLNMGLDVPPSGIQPADLIFDFARTSNVSPAEKQIRFYPAVANWSDPNVNTGLNGSIHTASQTNWNWYLFWRVATGTSADVPVLQYQQLAQNGTTFITPRLNVGSHRFGFRGVTNPIEKARGNLTVPSGSSTTAVATTFAPMPPNTLIVSIAATWQGTSSPSLSTANGFTLGYAHDFPSDTSIPGGAMAWRFVPSGGVVPLPRFNVNPGPSVAGGWIAFGFEPLNKWAIDTIKFGNRTTGFG